MFSFYFSNSLAISCQYLYWVGFGAAQKVIFVLPLASSELSLSSEFPQAANPVVTTPSVATIPSIFFQFLFIILIALLSGIIYCNNIFELFETFFHIICNNCCFI